MGFISSKHDSYGIIKFSSRSELVDKPCKLGLYDSDTDLLEVFILPENKRTIVDINCIEVVTNPTIIKTMKLLFERIKS